MKIQNKKLIAILALSLSLTSFSLPREFFDPHFGVDTDIFCKAYFSISSGLMEKEEVAINHLIIIAVNFKEMHSLHSNYIKKSPTIRAPPVLIF